MTVGGSGVPTPQEPAITEEMIAAGAQAMRDEGFVDWDDDTVPTFRTETDVAGNNPGSRIDTWVPPEQVARAVLAAALTGRAVVELPALDSCDAVDGGEDFTVAALVRADGTPKVHFDADDESEPGACLSWHADQAEALGLALVAAARRAHVLASGSRKDEET